MMKKAQDRVIGIPTYLKVFLKRVKNDRLVFMYKQWCKKLAKNECVSGMFEAKKLD